MDNHHTEAEAQDAHRAIGAFVARCSLLDYRVGQYLARWFCEGEKLRFLSYTLKAMPFPEKRVIIEERLAHWHGDPEALRSAMQEIGEVLERRNLAVSGVLSRRSSGALCIKSFSGAKFISGPGAVDILDIADLANWSERARELAERLVGLGHLLRDAPGA